MPVTVGVVSFVNAGEVNTGASGAFASMANAWVVAPLTFPALSFAVALTPINEVVNGLIGFVAPCGISVWESKVQKPVELLITT